MQYVINVDWLQIFGHDYNNDRLDVLYNCSGSYEFRLMEYSSRHFREIWEVLDPDGEKYAVIQRRPFSSIISADGCIVQLCNRELYRPLMAVGFVQFLQSHNIHFKSLSRLDVCFDSNALFDGLTHPSFIRGLMSGRYLKNNQAKVKWNFSSIANVGKPMECNSCSFGSSSSSVSTKMYNKSLELREVKNKPYIVESWAYNGLNTDLDVWRIEISIKSDATSLVHTSTGEIFKLSLSQLAFDKQVVDVFYTYAAKYFAFKRNTGIANKTRMPDLQIFPKNRQIPIRPIKITEAQDATRSDRIFLKKLHSLISTLHNMDEQSEKAVWEVSNTFVMAKSLEKWRDEKLLKGIEHHTTTARKLAVKSRLFRAINDLKSLYPDEYQENKTEINNLYNSLIKNLNK